MPLHLPPAPPAALRSVLAALGSPAAHGQGGGPAAPEGPRSRLQPELPLPLHELASFTPAAGSSATRLTGWRFLLRDPEAPSGTSAPAAAESVLTPDGWAFAYFCGGPYVAATRQALEQAESLDDELQPRLLSVPQLYMLTLWLHGDTAAEPAEGTPLPSDVLIPLAPAPPGIAAHRPHRAGALLPLLTRRVVPAPLMRTPA
ncbi:hypothetical protein H181DRAFT_04779 [Streptomyces sp. WMMB 714]|jgi:hypothetical protein|uniref:hypothetical protein n=1 Tax=Streptomyces sp. WMMB 714 TaxID=1286822 RepID=UPI0005F81F5B|nr:hypothetical protein [Streptomyces sp. WMMB 714]SCK52389.1 hypothetical protein H181DRAFT_04779 [Streptomyces sp. WMMB 714]